MKTSPGLRAKKNTEVALVRSSAAEYLREFFERQLEKIREIRLSEDRLFESDFDQMIKQLPSPKKPKAPQP